MTPPAHSTRRLVLALAFAGLLPAAARADDSARIAAAVDAAFRPLLQAHDVPGMVVAVTVAGRAHFFPYGVAARGGEAAVTRDTLFELGSVSKAFTATAAGYAVAAGKLSLDDTPGRHLPELRGSLLDRATLLHLGTYTAGGLPLQFPDAVTREGMLDWYRQWQPAYAPGERRQYSNPSIGLLGHVAATAMGRDYADLLESGLFPRLGLAGSFIRVPAAQQARYAWGHDKAGKQVRVNPGVLDAEGYGVKSSAADMLRFVQANLVPGTLDPAMQEAVRATQVAYFEVDGMAQGLGWEQYPWPVAPERLLAGNSGAMALQPHGVKRLPAAPSTTATLFNKTGSTNGFGAYVAFVPARGIGIVMLANRNFPNEARVAAAHAVLRELDGLAR